MNQSNSHRDRGLRTVHLAGLEPATFGSVDRPRLSATPYLPTLPATPSRRLRPCLRPLLKMPNWPVLLPPGQRCRPTSARASLRSSPPQSLALRRMRRKPPKQPPARLHLQRAAGSWTPYSIISPLRRRWTFRLERCVEMMISVIASNVIQLAKVAREKVERLPEDQLFGR